MIRARAFLAPWAILICLGGSCVIGDDVADSGTDAAAASLDYKIQGEYQGIVGDGNKWGADIIALGDGKFKSIGFRGGLPGSGWLGEAGEYRTGQLRDSVAVIEADDFTVEVNGESLRVLRDGELLGELKKQHRVSPTLEKKPPQGAVVLFDGTSVDQWQNGKLVDGKYLGATNCASRRTFGDHALHIEFRTPFMPAARGQGRGNSGVYLQSRYELQVLDSFGLEGKDNECGGIYQISAPKLNMCYPPLTWQTYDVEFTAATYDADGNKTANARATIRQNGEIIHDDLELPRATPGRLPEGPEPAGVFLQDHGNPVVYRNIWVVEK